MRGFRKRKEKGELLSLDYKLKSKRDNKRKSIGGRNYIEPFPEHSEDYHPCVQMENMISNVIDLQDL